MPPHQRSLGPLFGARLTLDGEMTPRNQGESMTPIALTGRVRAAVRGWLRPRSTAPGGERRGAARYAGMLFHPPGAIRVVTPGEIAAAASSHDAAAGIAPSLSGGTAR